MKAGIDFGIVVLPVRPFPQIGLKGDKIGEFA